MVEVRVCMEPRNLDVTMRGEGRGCAAGDS